MDVSSFLVSEVTMEVSVWKVMNWSYASKHTGRALFHLQPNGRRWKVVRIELFDDKGIPRGTAFRESFPIGEIRAIENQALKMHGTPGLRGDDSLDPVINHRT